jgi:hypothetical protein
MEERIIAKGQFEGSRKHFQKKYEMNKQSLDCLLSFIKKIKRKINKINR